MICRCSSQRNYAWRVDHVLAAFVCRGDERPLVVGFTQTINDYYDREIEAINEPTGRSHQDVPLGQVKLQIWVLLLVGWGVHGLDPGRPLHLVLLLALGGSFATRLFRTSLKLKQNGHGEYALGAATSPVRWQVRPVRSTDWHSTNPGLQPAGLGIAVVNDFKSVEDRGSAFNPCLWSSALNASWISAGN